MSVSLLQRFKIVQRLQLGAETIEREFIFEECRDYKYGWAVTCNCDYITAQVLAKIIIKRINDRPCQDFIDIHNETGLVWKRIIHYTHKSVPRDDGAFIGVMTIAIAPEFFKLIATEI